MIYLYLFASCIAFIELFILLDLKNEAVGIIARSRQAMGVVKSDDLDYREKEIALRRSCVQMIKVTLMFTTKFLFIVAVLYAMYWLMIVIFPELGESMLNSFVSPTVIVGSIVAAAGYAWVRNVLFRRL